MKKSAHWLQFNKLSLYYEWFEHFSVANVHENNRISQKCLLALNISNSFWIQKKTVCNSWSSCSIGNLTKFHHVHLNFNSEIHLESVQRLWFTENNTNQHALAISWKNIYRKFLGHDFHHCYYMLNLHDAMSPMIYLIHL